MLSVFSDESFMKQAFNQAKIAFETGEIPIGAVVVSNNKIIARAHNQTELLNDFTAHAEMLAIKEASDLLKIYRQERQAAVNARAGLRQSRP